MGEITTRFLEAASLALLVRVVGGALIVVPTNVSRVATQVQLADAFGSCRFPHLGVWGHSALPRYFNLLEIGRAHV